MSSIPQITDDGNSVTDFATKFLKRFHIGYLLFKCNAGKEKGILVMDIFRYLFCMMFSNRSIYPLTQIIMWVQKRSAYSFVPAFFMTIFICG